jgi:hypothetical protein
MSLLLMNVRFILMVIPLTLLVYMIGVSLDSLLSAAAPDSVALEENDFGAADENHTPDFEIPPGHTAELVSLHDCRKSVLERVKRPAGDTTLSCD